MNRVGPRAVEQMVTDEGFRGEVIRACSKYLEEGAPLTLLTMATRSALEVGFVPSVVLHYTVIIITTMFYLFLHGVFSSFTRFSSHKDLQETLFTTVMTYRHYCHHH